MADPLSADLQSLRIDRGEPPPRRPVLRVALWTTVIVAVLGVGAYIGLPILRGNFFRTEVSITEIVVVSPAQAAVELTSTGYVVPELTSKVGARVQGRIAKVYVKEGEQIKKGQLLAELDSAAQKSALASARARVLTAKARAQAARANVLEIRQQAKRQRTLVSTGAAAESVAADLEARASSLEESVRVADADAKAAQAEVDAMAVNLQYTAIYAPIGGTVINKPQEVGEMVGLGLERDAIVELADLSTLVVETDVPEARLDRVKIGRPCEIVLDAFPQKRFRGEVLEVRPRVNRAKATVPVKVRFIDPLEGVLPDMSARVSFLSKAIDDESIKEAPKTIVPKSALRTDGGETVVFVIVDGDHVKRTRIVLGSAYGNGFVVKEGPSIGTRIVDSPPRELRDGQGVKEKQEQ